MSSLTSSISSSSGLLISGSSSSIAFGTRSWNFEWTICANEASIYQPQEKEEKSRNKMYTLPIYYTEIFSMVWTHFVFTMALSGQYIIFDFPTRIQLYRNCIRCGFCLTHTQWVLGHMNFWISTSITEILENRGISIYKTEMKENFNERL